MNPPEPPFYLVPLRSRPFEQPLGRKLRGAASHYLNV
jgi:hypothetical protein